jgi:hypothetical protein
MDEPLESLEGLAAEPQVVEPNIMAPLSSTRRMTFSPKTVGVMATRKSMARPSILI